MEGLTDVTASDSSSPAGDLAEPSVEPSPGAGVGSADRPSVDLLAAGLLAPLPAAFLEGRDLDLLEPLSFESGGFETSRFEAGGGLLDGATPPVVARAAIAEALADTNAAYGHPRAEELAAKLADPATLVVVTGQQPGLLGGPLYTLSKAVAASLWAERLEASGRPAVAIFWVATEDHDFLESSRGTFLGAEGAISLDLGEDTAPLTPVGMRTFGPPISPLLDRLRAAQPGDRWAAWIDRMAQWYRPDGRFGEAFSRLLVAILGARSPLLLDSMLPALKAAQRPWLRLLVEGREEVEALFAEREARIQGRGYELQVKPQPGASPLFAIHGRQRRRIEWRGPKRLALRGALDGEEVFEAEVGWLLEAIEDNPGVVSPGVLARAPLQDAVLGSSLLVLGPGEVSYMPQVAPLYGWLGITPPRIALRPQALVLGGHQIDKLGGLNLGLADFVAPELDLDRALAEGREDDLLRPAREAIQRSLEALEASALELDRNLEGPWTKTRQQVERALDTFGGKVAAALARHDEQLRRRVEDLRLNCRPLGGLQERVLSTAHFPGKYGEALTEAYFEQLGLDPRHLQVISPRGGP